MMFIILPAVVAVLASLAAAAPQLAERVAGRAIPIAKRNGSLNADNSVNLDTLNHHVAAVKNKHHWRRLKSTVKGVEKRENIVHLTEFGSESWYGVVSVGDPQLPQQFEVVFDTGASDFFLPSVFCDFTCEHHTRWKPTSTSYWLKRPFSFDYYDGASVSGVLYTDMVSLAGLTATTQTLAAAMRLSPQYQFSKFPADGVLGMGFLAGMATGTPPLFQTLVIEGVVHEPSFSFKISTSGGELYIGGSNSALYTGNFVYVPVRSDAEQSRCWQVTIDSILGNGEVLLVDQVAIIDTGSNYIFGPASEVALMHALLGGRRLDDKEDYYVFPCDSFPHISFGFGGAQFPFSFSTISLGRTEGDPPDCVSAIVADDENDGIWLVGTAFLQNVYATFDLREGQVGFAQLAPLHGGSSAN